MHRFEIFKIKFLFFRHSLVRLKQENSLLWFRQHNYPIRLGKANGLEMNKSMFTFGNFYW